jgi:aspartate/methionine/tyrosine aminotransferase
MARFNPVFADLPTTIFTVMSDLARAHDAINLGQGFPDGDGPAHLRAIAAQAIVDGPNQYAPGTGLPELRRAVAEHDRRFHDLRFDPDAEIIVTSGATEALAATLLALLAPGDEAVVIEPAFDCYAPMIRASGAVPRFVPLRPPHWRLDEDRLAAVCGKRTRAIVLNNPMNPTGKVFSEYELSVIAEVLCRIDAVAVCDEVYEHLTFDGHRHVPLMCLPGMRERCVRIGSAGKTFSMTGWKVGYLGAPRPLAEVIARAHQFLTFATVPALQKAVAAGLGSDASYFTGLASALASRRDLLSEGLVEIGFRVLPCHGTYFLIADFGALAPGLDDMAFCRDITATARVAAIPVSAFCESGDRDTPRTLARFCFCKDPSVLSEALTRLRRRFA